jgi:hypothetical protein
MWLTRFVLALTSPRRYLRPTRYGRYGRRYLFPKAKKGSPVQCCWESISCSDKLLFSLRIRIFGARRGTTTVSKKPALRQPNAQRSPMLRSRVSNRPGGLAGVDGRSARARRFRDLTSGLKRDIGRALSAAEESLVDQAAALMLQREAMTAVGACGGSIDSRELVRVAGAVARTLAALGLIQRFERSTAVRIAIASGIHKIRRPKTTAQLR